MPLLRERHSDPIAGVLSCYDRILVQGTRPHATVPSLAQVRHGGGGFDDFRDQVIG